jgi:serine/threonine protein phosphatase PrpC
MEDEFVVVTDTKNIKKSANENYSFFGVFDGNNKCTITKASTCSYLLLLGHGGNECSKFAKEHLLKNILNSKYVNKDILKAIEEGFAITDKLFIENFYNEEKGTSGSTACCALVRGNKYEINSCFVAC